MTEDPFAALDFTTISKFTQLYVSGRLTLLRIPAGVCGEWASINFLTSQSSWHRKLDANAFLWLRIAVRRTIEAGKLTEEYADAEQILEQIAAIGIADRAFSADDIATHRKIDEGFQFYSGLPVWADEIGPDFLPPSKRKVKPALTGRW